jgi:hypothetical protein
MPTIKASGMGKPDEFLRISAKTPGAILQPQPPPCENEVRRIASVFMNLTLTLGNGVLIIGESTSKVEKTPLRFDAHKKSDLGEIAFLFC